jgi:hypothetical protein
VLVELDVELLLVEVDAPPVPPAPDDDDEELLLLVEVDAPPVSPPEEDDAPELLEDDAPEPWEDVPLGAWEHAVAAVRVASARSERRVMERMIAGAVPPREGPCCGRFRGSAAAG